MVHIQYVLCSLANEQASQWQVPSVNRSYKPICLLSAQQHTKTHTAAYTYENYTAHTLKHTHVYILGGHSPWGMTSKARAQGINRKQSQINGFQTGTLKATWEFLHPLFFSFFSYSEFSFLFCFLSLFSCYTFLCLSDCLHAYCD